jgi:hypothetical protein
VPGSVLTRLLISCLTPFFSSFTPPAAAPWCGCGVRVLLG